jgi:hypothetical protein
MDTLDLLPQLDELEGTTTGNLFGTLPNLFEDENTDIAVAKGVDNIGTTWTYIDDNEDNIQDIIYVATETKGVDDRQTADDGRTPKGNLPIEDNPATVNTAAIITLYYPTPPPSEDNLTTALSSYRSISLYAKALRA